MRLVAPVGLPAKFMGATSRTQWLSRGLFRTFFLTYGCEYGCEYPHLKVAPKNHDHRVRLVAPMTFRCELSGATLSHLKSHLKVSMGATFDLWVRKKSHPMLFFVLVNLKTIKSFHSIPTSFEA